MNEVNFFIPLGFANKVCCQYLYVPDYTRAAHTGEKRCVFLESAKGNLADRQTDRLYYIILYYIIYYGTLCYIILDRLD
jgi:hypothetical protein